MDGGALTGIAVLETPYRKTVYSVLTLHLCGQPIAIHCTENAPLYHGLLGHLTEEASLSYSHPLDLNT